MKRLLIFAVAVLALASCKNGGKTADKSVADSLAAVPAYDIAYVNMETLMNGYTMYTDLKAAFDKKASDMDKHFNTRGRKLQKDIMDYQEKVNNGLVTRAEAAQIEADLQKKSENFDADRQNAAGNLSEEQQVLLNKVYYAISSYVKDFNADGKFKMILANSTTGPVLDADPSMDITQLVLKGLNEKYAADKAKGKTDTTTVAPKADTKKVKK